MQNFEELPPVKQPNFVFIDEETGRTKINVLLVAQEVLNKTKFFLTEKALNGYVYTGQYWKQFKTQNVRDRMLKSEIGNILGKHIASKTIRDVLEIVLSLGMKNDLIDVFNKSPALVSFKNTAVDGDTMAFIPNDPNLYILGGFDFDIAETGNTEKTRALFEKTLGENAQFMIEFFGSMFHRDYRPFQYVVVIQGTAGSGKSYLVELMRALIGDEMTTSLSLEQIARDKFMTALLHGSYANIKSDLSNDFIPTFETINNLTGGDSLQVQFKGQDSFSFVNHAKLLFTANEAPNIKLNDGIKRRMKILNVKASVHVASDDDDDDYSSFMPERAAFVYYAMTAFMLAKKKRKMTLTEDIEKTTAEWFLAGDDVQEWVNEHLVVKRDSRPRSNWIYEQFSRDWRYEGLTNVPSSKNLMKRLRELGYEVKKAGSSLGNKDDPNDLRNSTNRIMNVEYRRN